MEIRFNYNESKIKNKSSKKYLSKEIISLNIEKEKSFSNNKATLLIKELNNNLNIVKKKVHQIIRLKEKILEIKML